MSFRKRRLTDSASITDDQQKKLKETQSGDYTRSINESSQNDSQRTAKDLHGYNYGNNDNGDRKKEEFSGHPFLREKVESIQKELRKPSSSKKGEIKAKVLNDVLDQIEAKAGEINKTGVWNRTKESRLAGGTPEEARGFINDLKKGNKPLYEKYLAFCKARVSYVRQEKKGKYEDSKGRAPLERAGEEHPEGYEMQKEYIKIYNRKEESIPAWISSSDESS